MGNFDDKNTLIEVSIVSEYITLGQFLKFVHLIDEGGMAKAYLATHEILVNDVLESRRGRKLRPGDRLKIGEIGYLVKSK